MAPLGQQAQGLFLFPVHLRSLRPWAQISHWPVLLFLLMPRASLYEGMASGVTFPSALPQLCSSWHQTRDRAGVHYSVLEL